MTPKEKAKELMQKAYDLDQHNKTTQSRCKQIAFLCVDEIELYRKQIEDEYDDDFYHAYGVEEYWQEVRQEISLL
tara:strand:- start:47 stop:271 length:225 start_codon:yes stop_codon:yes gene_type:complete